MVNSFHKFFLSNKLLLMAFTGLLRIWPFLKVSPDFPSPTGLTLSVSYGGQF